MNNTKYFVLDANAIYNYYGREKLGLSCGVKYNKERLVRLFDSNELFVIPCVLLEIFVHFRKDMNKLRDLLLFFLEKDIKCLSIGEVIIDQSFVDNFVKCFDDDKRKKQIAYALNLKINTETNLAYFYCSSIAVILSITIIDNFCKKYNLSDSIAMKYKEEFAQSVLNSHKLYTTRIYNDLQIGYNNNKEDAALKKSYDVVLKDYILQIESVTKTIANDNGIIHDFTNDSVLPDFNNLQVHQFVARYSANYIDNIDVLRDIFANSASVKNYPQVVIDYMKLKFDVYTTGTKYKKNDGYDTLYLAAYSQVAIDSINKFIKEAKIKGLSRCKYDNFHLVSFDYTLLRYIYQFDKEGALIANRLLEKPIINE